MSINQADLAALQGMYDNAGALQAKQLSNTYKLGKDEIAARLKIAAQSSKDNRYGIDAQRDTERARIEQARAEMERIGIPQMEINRFVAEANKALAESELSLKRDIFVADTQQKQAQLQLDREQMERIGIPQMEINRYIAEKSAELDRLTLGENARQFDTTFGEGQRQFNTTASGYMSSGPALSAPEQARYSQLKAQSATGAPLAPAEQAELQGLEQAMAASGGGGSRQATLEREKFWQDQQEQNRRYGLDVSKFGAELASTPDTYFQARRFQGVDVPRLMGGAGAQTNEPMGGPTPGVATMGAYLSGQDPYAQGGTTYASGIPGGMSAAGGGGSQETPGSGAATPQQQAAVMAGRDVAGGPAAGYGGASAGGDRGGTPYGGPGALGTASGGGPMGTPYGGASPTMQTGHWSPSDQATSQQPAPTGNAQLGMPGTPYDDRHKQIAAIAKTVPPSPYDGLDENDTNALKLMESIYKKGGNQIAGGEYERLQASGRLGYLQSAGKMLGYSPSDLENQYKSYRPSQGRAAAAG